MQLQKKPHVVALDIWQSIIKPGISTRSKQLLNIWS